MEVMQVTYFSNSVDIHSSVKIALEKGLLPQFAMIDFDLEASNESSLQYPGAAKIAALLG